MQIFASFFLTCLAASSAILAAPAATTTASASAASTTPLFYLQVTNGTRAGQFLTSPIDIGNQLGLVTWTSNLKNATTWTYFQYPAGSGIFTGVRALKRPDHDVLFSSIEDPSLIRIVGPATVNQAWPVSIKLKGWDAGNPVGQVVLADPQLTQYKQWDGCTSSNALAVSSSVNGGCLQSLQFIRVSSCGN